MPRTSADSSTISDLTRAKLAGELILPLTHQRRGPCLRKLVHWSNLLSVLTAECDWFDHLLEEIDDSDSESESSDGLPDPALLHNILPAPPRPSRRPRARRDPAGLGLPHWGFLCVRPTEEELKTTAEDDEDSHLPSLVPIKSYDFIIAADALLDGQTVLVKYLVGGYNGHPRPPSSSFLHPHTHHQHSAGLGHASHDHLLIDARRGSAARRTPAPKHPDIRVTKLHIVLNHLSLPSPAAPPAGRPKEDDNLGLDGRLSPDYLDQPASDPHQILLWRVFAIGNPCPF
ncbi:hypothetical protein PtB15_7B293 [Puccinia triticina]|nr:hypothetical protein PtB15_7B293 [Puccinia triticina]